MRDREVLDVLDARMSHNTARGLVSALSAALRDGALPPGTRLPPIRTVGTQLGLSPTTVSAAWASLARSGAIRTDGRRGTTITDLGAAPPGRYRKVLPRDGDFRVDLSTGIPCASLLPDLTPALHSLTAATPSSYLDVAVLPELHDALAVDWPYPCDRFLVTDGAMDAVEAVMRATVRVGDHVVVEHPGFPPILDLIDALGAHAVGVALDGEGMVPAQLAAVLDVRVAAVVLQPRAHNPTGVSTTPHRLAQLAEVLTGSAAIVVEDDSAGAIARAPMQSLGHWLPQRTVHVRSFSKSHGPDLRLAALSGPHDLLNELEGRRRLGQGWSSRLLQRILVHLLTDGHAIDEVAAARTQYVRRRAYAVDALAAAGVCVGGDDGINIWVPVADERNAVVRLASQGIGVAPGTPFAVLALATPHIRVTCGLLDVGEGSGARAATDQTLQLIAAAATTDAMAIGR